MEESNERKGECREPCLYTLANLNDYNTKFPFIKKTYHLFSYLQTFRNTG